MEQDNVPDRLVERAYRDLTRIHRYLGDIASVMAAVRNDPLPVRRVLDVGCGRGGVLQVLRRKLGVDVMGVDLNAPCGAQTPFEIRYCLQIWRFDVPRPSPFRI